MLWIRSLATTAPLSHAFENVADRWKNKILYALSFSTPPFMLPILHRALVFHSHHICPSLHFHFNFICLFWLSTLFQWMLCCWIDWISLFPNFTFNMKHSDVFVSHFVVAIIQNHREWIDYFVFIFWWVRLWYWYDFYVCCLCSLPLVHYDVHSFTFTFSFPIYLWVFLTIQ